MPRHVLVAIEEPPVAARVIRGMCGGGGARGAVVMETMLAFALEEEFA